MIGAGTAELQEFASEIAEAIDDYGQLVTIRRPGRPDAQAVAVLYQLDDKETQGKVGEAAFKVLAWMGIFKPDAPVRERGFTVIDRQGRVFTPDGETQNAVEQDVVLFVHLLPLADRTRVSDLTFQVPGSLIRDARGNRVPGPGQPLPVSARLTATTDPRVRETVGADKAEIVLVGRWGTLEHPQGRPAGVNWGAQSPLELDGQPGTLTLKLAWPDEDLATEQQFGARFLAVWRTP